MFEYEAFISRVVDGDTVIAQVDLGFTVHADVILRLARINAPEMKTLEGPKSKQFLSEKLFGRTVRIKTKKEPDKSKDSYGRYIAEIFLDDVCINDLLVEKALAEYKTY